MPREHPIIKAINTRIAKAENRLAQLTLEQCALEEGIKADRALLAGAQPKQPRAKKLGQKQQTASESEKGDLTT